MAARSGDTSPDSAPSVVRAGPGGIPRPARPLRHPVAAAPARFGVHVDLVAGRLILTGRLDGHSTHLLYDACSALLDARNQDWTVDVGGLADLDEAGLRALLVVYHRSVRHGCRISVQGASPALRRALTVLRLDRHVLPGEAAVTPADPAPGPP